MAETQLCIDRRAYQASPRDDAFSTYFLTAILQALGIVHIFLGTMIFSSLLFIAVNDTWPIVIRYATSSVAVQLIRLYEIISLQSVSESTTNSIK